MIKVTVTCIQGLGSAGTFNSDFEADQWLAQEIAKGTWGVEGNYSVSKEDDGLTPEALAEKSEALDYLKNTDWYIVREVDSGVPCPQEIKAGRAAARLKI